VNLQSRPWEEILIFLLLGLVAAISILQNAQGGILTLEPVRIIAVVAVFGLAGYSALAIRRNLSIGALRRQASGMVIVAVAAGYYPLNFAISTFIPQLQNFGFYYFVFVAPITIFFWVDASILAVRRSDPFFRDSFHWSRVRVLFWALIAIPSSFNVVVFGILGNIFPAILNFFYSTGLLFAIPGAPTTLPQYLFAFVFLLMPAFLAVGTGPVLLPLIFRKAKDLTLRRHLKWFGGFAILFALGFPLFPINLQFVALAVGGYFLYRSVLSLVPIYQFSDDIRGNVGEVSVTSH
jgi:hypothetical protein